MIFIVSRYLVPRYYNGITLWPFIIMRHNLLRTDPVFVNHEKIHLRQQMELFILPFYVWYLFEFLVRLIQYKNWSVAYHNISFEREAYANEKDLNYLKQRSFWKFRYFLLKNKLTS